MELLREEGYEVVACRNLGDVWMNTERGLDQIAVVDASREFNAGRASTSVPRLRAMANSLPLVLITDGSSSHKQACAHIEAAALLGLPFDVEQLLDAVEQARCTRRTPAALRPSY